MELQQIREHIEALKEGEEFIWPESDYGKAQIWLKNGTFFIFAIPMYGGIPVFAMALKRVDDVIRTIESWT